MKKTISIITLLCLIIVTAFSGGAQYNDINGHWAESAINSWSERNIINGYDGNFRPDDSITRGETAVILDRIIKLDTESDNTFSDLDRNFYTSAILKANHAGIILGDGSLMRPNDAIILQEAVVMICRAFEIKSVDGDKTEFIDDRDISDWARGYINAMVKVGFLHGSEGYLNSQADITRAQFITILNNMYNSGQKALTFMIDGEEEEEITPSPLPLPEPTATPSESPTPSAAATGSSGGGGSGNSGSGSVAAPPEPEEDNITITTSLTDGAVQRGSKKTFDVWATDSGGNKINSEATLNGQPVPANWDDDAKTSFTLYFTDEGENEIVVMAENAEGKKKSVTYHMDYQRAELGETIGTAVFCIEAFSVGCGYIVPPQYVEVLEGENAAEMLDRVINQAGLGYENTGTLFEDFYLAAINQLDIEPNIPEALSGLLERQAENYDPDDRRNDRLAEFNFTNGSGWMFCLNNIFPNVGFADTYLSDEDVVRVQYTLYYGMDNGGYVAAGNGGYGYFESPDRDSATVRIAEIGIDSCDSSALELITKIDASSAEIRTAMSLLN